jgi:hypothetical protein
MLDHGGLFATLRRVPLMNVERFDDVEGGIWDGFVSDSLNGTLSHTRRFLAYHPPERFIDHSLIVRDDQGRIAALFPAAEVADGERKILHSHPGATYGGFVIDARSHIERNRAIVEAVCKYASEMGFHAIRLRSSEPVFHRRFCEELDAALFQARFSLEGRELSCAVNCHGRTADELLAGYRLNARNAIHKAQRSGVTAAPCDDFAAFWSILEKNLRTSHDVRPTHTLDELLRLRDLIGEQIVLIGGYWQAKLISGVVLFIMNQQAMHTMYMAQDYEYQQLRSLNLAVHAALIYCAEQGSHYLNFGISSIPGTLGMEMNRGLDAFKRSYGGEGVLRELWYKSL